MPYESLVSQNTLLAALPDVVKTRLGPVLELELMPLGKIVHASERTMQHLYFPTDCIVSLLNAKKDLPVTEISVVGNEGAVGVAIFLSGTPMPSDAVVQGTGSALRLSTRAAEAEFARGGSFQKLLLLYVQILITNIAQTAYCNKHHVMEEQLCRWLLLSLDRIPTNTLKMTHQTVAIMLGARRETVSLALAELQRVGAVVCARGRIVVTNRQRLESRACGCYAQGRGETRRLLKHLSGRALSADVSAPVSGKARRVRGSRATG